MRIKIQMRLQKRFYTYVQGYSLHLRTAPPLFQAKILSQNSPLPKKKSSSYLEPGFFFVTIITGQEIGFISLNEKFNVRY